MSKESEAYKFFGVTESEVGELGEKLGITGKPDFENLTKVLESDCSENMKLFACYYLGVVRGQLDVLYSIKKGEIY